MILSKVKKFNIIDGTRRALRVSRALYIPVKLGKLGVEDPEFLLADVVLCSLPLSTRSVEVSDVGSYVIVGEVAIISCDERLQGREAEVALELLRRHKRLKAVYAKVRTEGEFRTPHLVLLAGQPVEATVYREGGLRFYVLVGKVYINPRLAFEHEIVPSMIGAGSLVLDMFSGIGPFSLKVSSKGRAKVVVANDLNPYAVQCLLKSVAMNRKLLLAPMLVLKEDAAELGRILRSSFDVIIMNLPHASVKYISTALRLCRRKCRLHIYVIARSEREAFELVRRELEKFKVSAKLVDLREALDYAPHIGIYRVTMDIECTATSCH